MRAIDGDALEKEGWSLHRTVRVDRHTSEYQVKQIAKVPTIEPERTGKWIHGRELAREMISDCIVAIRYDGWRCSECDYLVEQEREPLYKFCPNCGARMERRTDE